jgi:2-polyprenyl-6-methoxyphenol hydroxylase-like FAD-dependent oxidoreductase
MSNGGCVIVGGGPAGAVTALQLARAGVHVTVVERARFPRRKACGEYLSPGTVRVIDGLGLGERVRARAAVLRGVRLVTREFERVLPFAEPALAIDRATFDAELLAAACDAGAAVVHGRAEDVVTTGGRATGVVVRDESGEQNVLSALVVVGADGNGSLVARRLGLARRARGSQRFAVGGHYEGFGVLDGLIEMFADEGGYFALNPLSRNCANAMVVMPERQLTRAAREVDETLRRRAAELGRGIRSLEGAERIGARIAIGPLSFNVAGCVAPGALLVGDAAGTLDPFMGQGVYLAVTGALDAAVAVGGAIAAPRRERALFASYERARKRELRARRRLALLVGTIIRVPLLARRVSRKLARAPRVADAMVAAISGLAPPQSVLTPRAVGTLFL